MLTSIIIPSFNGALLLESCLSSLREYTPEPYEVIVVDNGSHDETMEVCRKYRCRFIRFPRNQGFPIACNAGLKLARGELLVLLNNDVLVSNNWLHNMRSALLSSPKVGIVGPLTNYASGIQRVKAPPYATLSEYLQIRDSLNTPDPAKWRDVERLVGFCMLFRRQLLHEIGLLDERFSPGHYEDDDYCHRTRAKGYRLLIAGDTFVHHHGSASFRKQHSAYLKKVLRRNLNLFIRKWGYDPRTLIHRNVAD